MSITVETITHEILSDFLRHGRYLRNWGPRTVETYDFILSPVVGTSLTKVGLNAHVVALRERGLATATVNIRLRALNSLLGWLHEDGRIEERLRVKLLRAEQKPITILSDDDLRRLITFRPRGRNFTRAHTLVMLLLDTGLRISEALSLPCARVDLDGLILRVVGKGNRERLVPISLACRKYLWRHLRAVSAKGWLFTTASGSRLSYRNAHRDLALLCQAAGVQHGQTNPHAFRHCFAVTYIRRGGDIYRLSRLLGHASISTTQIYLRSMGIEHLREAHDSFSPLTA